MTQKQNKEELQYSVDTTPNGDKAILGKLEGVCADTINPTRNGRKYSEKLWETVFNDSIIKEQFNAGGIFGELGHPDREEVDISKVAICMPEPPKKNSKGQLVGHWDILNTPCGQILKVLCDYGYKMGISTRGSGDTFTDSDGNESVDPDSYQLTALDIVLVPAVKAARLDLVTESLDTKSIKFKKALNEAIEKSSDEDKKIMIEALNDLDINYTTNTGVSNIDSTQQTDAANNVGANVMVEWKKALKENKKLQEQVVSLQHQLSVCYTKDSDTSVNNQKLSAERNHIQEELNKANSTIESTNAQIKDLNKKYETCWNDAKLLAKELSKRDTLNNSLMEENESIKKEYEQLNEKYQEDKKDFVIKQTELNNEINSQKQLTEKYKLIAKTAIDRYILLQSNMLNVSPTEIKNKLSENYSFKDIDRVCESFKDKKIKFGSVPMTPKTVVKVTKSEEPLFNYEDSSFDDEVDADILNCIK